MKPDTRTSVGTCVSESEGVPDRREDTTGGGEMASRCLSGCRPWARILRVAVLLAVDLMALGASAWLAYYAWARPVHHQSLGLYRPLFPLLALFPLGYLQAGLYPGFGLGAVETLRRLSTRTSFIYLSIAAMSFVLKAPQHYSRMMFTIGWALSLVAVPLSRYLVLGVVRRWRWWPEPAVVVGRAGTIRPLIHALRQARSIGYRPVAELILAEDVPPGLPAHLPILGTLEDAATVAALGLRVAFVPEDRGNQHWKLLESLHQHFRHVIVVRPVGGTPVLGVQVRTFGGVLGLEFTNELLKRRNRLIKRSADLLLGGLGLMLAIPVMAVAAVAIQIFSRGPVLYAQEREGLHGRPIRVWKLRTMLPDAETRLQEHLEANPRARKEWEHSFKLSNDPRLVPVAGRFLRRSSIDELPQLVNVLRGDMSLVGPRPFPSYHLKRFSPDFRRLRRRVRPGMTGLWQVLSRGRGELADQEALDTHYIRNWSLWMDLYVLGKTVAAVLGGRGAY